MSFVRSGPNGWPQMEPERKPSAAARLLGQMRGASGGALESADGVADMSTERQKGSCAALEETLRANAALQPEDVASDGFIETVISDTQSALSRLADGGPDAQLSARDQVMLEAVVLTDGSRPSIPIVDNQIDANDPRLGCWKLPVLNLKSEIARAARATGRILVNGSLDGNSVAGTAFFIAPGLVATAKHVVEQVCAKTETGQWKPRDGFYLELDFNVEADAPAQPDKRIQVDEIIWASPDTILNGGLDLAKLDLAVLKLAENGRHPCKLSSTFEFPAGDRVIHAIGHPARPMAFPGIGDTAEFKRLRNLIFGTDFGIKRWSPGHIMSGPGEASGDLQTRIITHDASTLGGNSGCPVFDLTDFGDRVMGLHYYGTFAEHNIAHSAPGLRPFLEPLAPNSNMYI